MTVVHTLLDLVLEWAQIYLLQAKAINLDCPVQAGVYIRYNPNWSVGSKVMPQ